ncbi:MAG TPA: Xaa-Pro peptidase family protein [Anaerolineaceae bacterium]|nr:Xaa-Pro peptidase family protein [Anaerolineaceae bacterium]HPN50664.1 Xaa-Pro peptidase family protein [Anaerolineaceae bacterium]
MKTDLDCLMQSVDADAMLVVGAASHNPAMYYFTGGGHISQADLIKKRGEAPVLFHGPMERDEAAKTGLRIVSYNSYPWKDLLERAGGNTTQAMALRYQMMFKEAGVESGKVLLYGRTDVGQVFAVLSALQALMPGLTFMGDVDGLVLIKARETKSPEEVEHIRRMGKITTTVVGRVADYLKAQKVEGDHLVDETGRTLVLRDVKQRIELWLAELGAENPEGTIFAIGADAGVPHSSGNPDDVLRLGAPIVFDIYPCEAGGGYFYDFTRTWCLGFAPEPVQKLYDEVKSVYDRVVSELKAGEPASRYQQLTCELFEAMGHPTVLHTPETTDGYCHSVGHGLGLQVHEKPAIRTGAANPDYLVPGSVFTIEPGLYYPGKGMGVRIEDTYWVAPDGKIEVLAEFPYDLILPVGK